MADEQGQPKKNESEDKKAEAPASDLTEKASEAQSSSDGKPSTAKEEQPIRDGYMMVKVYSPYQVYFDEEAKSISAVNDTGPFDILPQHHKFLTLLTACELSIITDKGEEKIKISRGIMYVKADRVTVFLDV